MTQSHADCAGLHGPQRKAQPGVGKGASATPRVLTPLVALTLLTLAGHAAAQTKIVPSISVQETVTNNVDLSPNDQRTTDFVTQITPAVAFQELGSHTRLDGSVSIPIVLYARTGAENNSVYPNVNILGDVNFFDRMFHVEGAVNVSQQFFTPFGAQPQDFTNATDNRYRATTYRVSPYLQGNVGNGIAYELRNNNIWANLSGAPVSTENSVSNEFLAKAQTTGDRQFGWTASYDYIDTRFNEQNSIVTQLARVAPNWSVDPQLRLDLSGGWEENRYTFTSSNGPIYGAGFRWRPSERTNVTGMWEHRFFGSSYNFTFDHRTPLSVWSIQASRNITTYPQQLASLAAGASVTGYLDQLFLSTYPNPIDRQQAVDQFIRDRGLSPTLSNPVTLYTEQILLVQQASATVGLIGARNTVFLSVFNVKNEPITAAGNVLPPSLFSQNDNTQTGGSVVWNNRISQRLNLATSVTALQTKANAPLVGNTRQAYAQTTLSAPFGAYTTGYVGARYQTLTSNVQPDYNEAAVFVGVTYTLR